jgi:hypothetical protein
MEQNSKKIIWSVVVIVVLIILVVWGLAKTKPADDMANENAYDQATTTQEQQTAAQMAAQSSSDDAAAIEADLNATDYDAAIMDK